MKPQWKGILLILEFCLCTPYSNPTLERFFKHMKLVKTTARSRLSSDSLNSILRVRVTGPTLTEFRNTLNKECIKRWNIACKRRPGQQKRKIYSKRKSSKKSRVQFDISEFTEDSDENSKQDKESDLESESQSESETDCKLEDGITEINKGVS